MLQNTLREKMKSGQAVNGIFINSGSSIACEIAGLAGFDFALIDSEHGPTDVLTNRNLITAAEYRGIAPIIRVSNKSEDLILRTLDVGAHGIMVPQVNTAEQAAAIVGAAKYYPEGHRGVATTRAAIMDSVCLSLIISRWQISGILSLSSAKAWRVSRIWMKSALWTVWMWFLSVLMISQVRWEHPEKLTMNPSMKL